jgi:hypothetical protein
MEKSHDHQQKIYITIPPFLTKENGYLVNGLQKYNMQTGDVKSRMVNYT